jgi:hypothetical protein
MNLLKALFMILSMWRTAFCKQAAFIRSKELAFACLGACSRKTITSMAIAMIPESLCLPVAAKTRSYV